jgi:hypothetical protein
MATKSLISLFSYILLYSLIFFIIVVDFLDYTVHFIKKLIKKIIYFIMIYFIIK